MNIVFHAHHAELSDAVQRRAASSLRKLAERLRRAMDATVRVAADGPLFRVEVTLRTPRREPLVAVGTARQPEVALGGALERLRAHVAHERASRARRISQLRRASEAVHGGAAQPGQALLAGRRAGAEEQLEA